MPYFLLSCTYIYLKKRRNNKCIQLRCQCNSKAYATEVNFRSTNVLPYKVHCTEYNILIHTEYIMYVTIQCKTAVIEWNGCHVSEFNARLLHTHITYMLSLILKMFANKVNTNLNVFSIHSTIHLYCTSIFVPCSRLIFFEELVVASCLLCHDTYLYCR